MNMDNEPFWKLLRPVHQTAAAFCLKLTGDRDEAADLYQDALLNAWNRFGSLRDKNLFRPWLFRILVNCFKNHQRSWWKKRRVTLTPEMIEIQPGADPRDGYKSCRRLSRILDLLSAEDRALVVLHEIDGWSLTELAELFQNPEGTIKTKIFRAKQMMRLSVERALGRKNGKTDIDEAIYALRRSSTTND
jgi:RNA polymerase sigma-70 factor (ECF subfamily)